ncbi:MAG: right-handed parallel beta-helix repeat-containing protein [bacterium]|nr:right-handed parallel beta-helix repeat-containing protein [bacterium]
MPPPRIVGNHAGFQVGGIFGSGASRVLVKNTLFASNTAGDACGAFVTLGCTGTLLNSIIAHNTAGALADGVAFQSVPYAALHHRTIADNRNTGVWTFNSVPLQILNSIVHGHSPAQIVDLGANSVAHYSRIQGGFPGFFNPTNDPAFINRAALNFQLQPFSPCIDKGATLFSVGNDCIGEHRPYGFGWNIGAYEFVPEPAGLALAVAIVWLASRPSLASRTLSSITLRQHEK